MDKVEKGQIVKGIAAGVYVVLYPRTVEKVPGAQVKPVDPTNHARRLKGQFWLSLGSLEPV